MKGLNGLVSTAVVALVAGGSAPAAFPQSPIPASVVQADAQDGVRQIARAGSGGLHGVVKDETGAPVEGATVSAIGETMAFAVTDRKGRYTFDNLPAGRYLLRANRAGFSLPERQYVTIRGAARTVKGLALQRTDPIGTSGAAREPHILAAGLGGEAAPSDEAAGEVPQPEPPTEASAPHPHTEVAWRLRHARRNVLKDTTVTPLDGDERSVDAAGFADASAVASLFAALPFSGEINLLTSGTLDRPRELFADGVPRGITYVQLGSTGEGAPGWTVQAAMNQGDVSSWIVAGSFSAGGPRAHALETGLSYGAQQYSGGNPAALAVRSDGSRRVGAVYGFDNWALSRRVHLAYGARVARYDYVDRESLWSPRVALTLNLGNDTHLRTAVSQRMRAPGAEEFLPPQTGGPWLPPERTFSPIGGDDFRVERIRQLEVALEREFESGAVFTLRRFVEQVDDQLVTIFGARTAGEPRSDVGHYLVGTAGAVDADGWSIKLSSSSARRLRGAIDYTRTHARWAPDVVATAAVLHLSPSAVRTEEEEVHDLAMSGEADISETATRVFMYYRVSTGYARADDLPLPSLGGRFDLQVRQGLPFMPFRGSEWQVLVGIRDLFRDPLEGSSSVFDELLVVRPPKRVIGGVQVKF